MTRPWCPARLGRPGGLGRPGWLESRGRRQGTRAGRPGRLESKGRRHGTRARNAAKPAAGGIVATGFADVDLLPADWRGGGDGACAGVSLAHGTGPWTQARAGCTRNRRIVRLDAPVSEQPGVRTGYRRPCCRRPGWEALPPARCRHPARARRVEAHRLNHRPILTGSRRPGRRVCQSSEARF